VKKDKIKCLFGTNESARVVIKKGFVDELLIDCRPVLIGFYETKNGWTSVDINTGLSLLKHSKTSEQCFEETKEMLHNRGYRRIKQCRKKAKQVYQKVYESEDWLK
jgi:hypothetical protein